MRPRVLASAAFAASIVVSSAVGVAATSAGGTLTPHLTTHTINLSLTKAYNPLPPSTGGTDLYHCSLLDPKVTTDQMIVKSVFTPGVLWEVHHAILYYVPASLASVARTADQNGKGWTCFGGPAAPGAGAVLGSEGGAKWLAGWSPGAGPNVEPTGTGVPLPKGSLIVMQIHYNMLRGHTPDLSKVTLTTVDAAGSGLLPLQLLLRPAAIDVPCPTGVHGTLCSRAASLADIGKRFGQAAVNFDNGLEAICNGGTPKAGSTSTCTLPVGASYRLYGVTPHMHLLGLSMKVTLLHSNGTSQVLVNDSTYDFHYQHGFPITPTVVTAPSDRIRVSCTYNAKLRTTLPYLKNLPPRYILWADGSSDEMCLAIISAVSMSATPMVASHVAGSSSFAPTTPQWPSALLSAIASRSVHGVLSPAARTALLNEITYHLSHCGVG